MDEILDEKTYETREVQYASFAARSAALLIDVLLLLMATYGLYVMFGRAPSYADELRRYWWQAIVILVFYFVYLEGSEKNATFGKQVMDIRLLDEGRRDVDFTVAAKYLLFSSILFFGYFRMMKDAKRQTLADKICKVTVIKVR